MSVEVNNAMVLNNDVANFDGTKIKMSIVQYSDVYLSIIQFIQRTNRK